MPVLNDILDHKVLGREFKRGIETGKQNGIAIGRKQQAIKILSDLITKRFGPVPDTAKTRLEKLSVPELEILIDRLFGISSLEELFNA